MAHDILALNIALITARDLSTSIVYITPDKSGEHILSKLLLINSGISNYQFKSQDWLKFQESLKKLININIFIQSDVSSINEIEKKAKTFKYQGIKLIIIENINFFLEKNSNNDKLIIQIKNLAILIRLPIIIIADLPSINLKNKFSSHNKPALADLEPIYEYCDTVLFTYRTGRYEDVYNESIEISIPKQYFNGEGTTNLMFNQELGKFICNPLPPPKVVKNDLLIPKPIFNDDDVPF